MSHGLRLAVAAVAGTLVALAATALAAPSEQKLFPAFPGAEGAGAYTPGGRGGKVLLVTTLADYDPRGERPIEGSLRAALAMAGPRVVLFRVAGTIDLKSDLAIVEPYVTIAGQSAPGDGVCLKGSSLQIGGHDVVVRYLRVRPGDIQRRELDCISCSARNVILDHCSATWGIDETISTNGNSANVTVQWCLIAESLNGSVHHKGPHGYGSLISGPGEISYHHNVYAFHRSRNPRPGDVLLDFRNNLIYGWKDRAGYDGDDRLHMNYVGNYLRALDYSRNKDIAFMPGGLSQRLYVEGNWFEGEPEGSRDNWKLIKPAPDSTAEETMRALRAEHPFPSATVATETAAEAYENILKHVGAILPVRDAVDRRIVEAIEQNRGAIIDSQDDVGGWPELASGTPAADRDLDGMPDAWEERYGLDSAKADLSSRDSDRDGFTDLEEFLNGTNPREADAWIDPPAISSSAGDAFLAATTLTMTTASSGAEIRYTLDDSEPTRTSTLYRTPVVVNESATVRAKAFLEDAPSHVRNLRLSHLTLHPGVAGRVLRPGLRYAYWERLGTTDWEVIEKSPPARSGAAASVDVGLRDRNDDFGLRFTGLIEAPTDGIYTFYLRCAPRGRLNIAGELVVENAGRKHEHCGKVALARGLHPIAFTIYYRNDDNKTLEIDYEGPGILRRPISEARLVHGPK